MAALAEFKRSLGDVQKVSKRTAERARLRHQQKAEAERIEFDSLLAENLNPYEVSVVLAAFVSPQRMRFKVAHFVMTYGRS